MFIGKEKVFTVTALNEAIKKVLEPDFRSLTVEGEVSGFKPNGQGHWYFDIKDNESKIGVAVWRNNVWKIGFIPKNGDKVIIKGYLSVYSPGGVYKIICTELKKSGIGDILAALEERKRHYQALGYFDPKRKKSIPKNPSRIAVITSKTGAALQDILNITGRRSTADIIILPAVVQGAEADKTIAERIIQANKYKLADVIIVGRGGGSVEDLLPFSSDVVVEAIHNSVIPVISAVGHETDWSLSDYVADLRAPTPSAAAELVSSDKAEHINALRKFEEDLKTALKEKIRQNRLELSLINTDSLKYVLIGKINRYRMNNDRFVAFMYKTVKEEKIGILKERFKVSDSRDLKDVVLRKTVVCKSLIAQCNSLMLNKINLEINRLYLLKRSVFDSFLLKNVILNKISQKLKEISVIDACEYLIKVKLQQMNMSIQKVKTLNILIKRKISDCKNDVFDNEALRLIVLGRVEKARNDIVVLKDGMYSIVKECKRQRKLKLESFGIVPAIILNNMIEHVSLRLKSYIHLLEAYNPQNILDKGYSIVTDANKKVVVSASEVEPGDYLNLQFKNGRAEVSVLKKENE